MAEQIKRLSAFLLAGKSPDPRHHSFGALCPLSSAFSSSHHSPFFSFRFFPSAIWYLDSTTLHPSPRLNPPPPPRCLKPGVILQQLWLLLLEPAALLVAAWGLGYSWAERCERDGTLSYEIRYHLILCGYIMYRCAFCISVQRLFCHFCHRSSSLVSWLFNSFIRFRFPVVSRPDLSA